MITLVSILLVLICIILHMEVLRRASQLMKRLKIPSRFKIGIGVLGAILGHNFEILLFALAYYLVIPYGDFGSLLGSDTSNLFRECAYFSFTTYTSLGYGDITPEGKIRFLASTEALTGLVLIAWTASFMFMQMRKYWHADG